jgi:hypothetical protein
MDAEQEQQMMQYLLGQLPEQEQAELEDKFLADDTCFEELLIVEEELRDAYTRGELSASDRKAFDQRLLNTPQQRQKQQFAQALLRYEGQARSAAQRVHSDAVLNALLRFLRTRPILVPALSAGLLVVIAGGVWLARKSAAPVGPVPAESTPRNQRAGAAAEKEPVAGKPPQAEEQKTVALILTGDLVRSHGQALPTLIIPPNVGRVRLEVRVEGDYRRYEAILQNVEGKTLSRNADLEPQKSAAGRKSVAVLVPSNLLGPGDYILTVRGLRPNRPPETVGEYTFRVAKM